MKIGRSVLIIGGLILATGVIFAGCKSYQGSSTTPTLTPTLEPTATPVSEVSTELGKDARNATYIIEGKPVTLTDGKAQTPVAPGSSTMVTTELFSETKGELTGDTHSDSAVMLTQNQGGSGTFFYEAAALYEGGEYRGTNGILLGDRIAPQTTQVANLKITVNYAERAPGEPMTAKPSVGVSKYFKVDGTTLVETTQN
jgi:hypothetical protein